MENDFEAEFNALESQDIYWFDSQKIRLAKSVHTSLEENPYVGSILSLYSLVRLVNTLGINADDFTLAFLYKNAQDSLNAGGKHILHLVHHLVGVKVHDAFLSVRYYFQLVVVDHDKVIHGLCVVHADLIALFIIEFSF